MKKIICDKIPRIVKNRKKLEKELNVKITNSGMEVSIDGKPENEYCAEMVVEALDMGFPFGVALLIKKEDNVLEVLSIKDYARRKDFKSIRARIIGKSGKTLRVLHELTECFFELKNNNVGILGSPERIKNAQEAVISIIKGSKQANVYSFLEKHRVEPILDLGLKK